MIRIMLACAGGMSTSLLMNKMKEEAKKQNAQVPKNLCVMAGVVSFELTARGFGDRCSTS